MKKNEINDLIKKVQNTSSVKVPVQKVVPVTQVNEVDEKSFLVKIPTDMLVFLKNKASFVQGLSVKELINNALLETYGDEYQKFLKNYVNRQ